MAELLNEPMRVLDRSPRERPWVTALVNSLREAFWVFLVGVLAVFVFFIVLGGISLGQTVGLSVAMAVVLLAWVFHAWRLRGRIDEHDPRLVRARERRGF